MFRPSRRDPLLRPASRRGRGWGTALWLALCAGGPASGADTVEVAALTTASGSLSEESLAEESLFEEAFGRKAPARPRAIPLELELEGRAAGFVNTLLPRGGAKGEALPQAAPLLEALDGVLQEEVHARLAAAVDAGGFVPLQALRDVGLEASYDPARLLLRVGVPPRLRSTRVSSLSSRRVSGLPADAVPTSRVSGFLNLRLAQDFSWAHAQQGAPARQPLRLGLESALNVSGWVLEGRGELAEGPQSRWTRGDLRLVRDFTAHALRFVAGNLVSPPSGFQPGRAMLGVSAARHFSLDPSRQFLPEEAVAFFLERPSKVEVFVNGRLAQTLQLAAGPQDLRGLSMQLGSNELELVITDAMGTQQRITKRVGLASGQLAPGVSEFAYSLGFPLQPGSVERAPEWTRPTLHLVHRQGLGNALTLGGSLQADPTTQGVSLAPLWATFLGSVSPSAALSHQAGTLGYAAGLRYELRQGGSGRGPFSHLGLGGEYRSLGFTLPGELPSTLPSYALNALYGRSLGQGFYGQLSAEARAQGVELEPTYGATLTLTKSFRNGLALMLDATARMPPEGEQELRGRFNLVWAWPDARRSVQAITDVGTRAGPSAQLAVHQQLDRGSTTVNASARLAHDDAGNRVSESLLYRGQRAEAEVSHRLVSPVNAPGNLDSVVQTRVGVALVFADGVFALSRPVTNSFAIVAPTHSLKGQWVGVNRSVQGYAGAADGLGPAVLPDLQPYAWSQLKVDAPELPLGSSLGQDKHSLRPTYRSGTVVRVGEEGSVLLRGVLRDEQGEPVALGSGSIQRLSEDLDAPTTFFTNRAGRFALDALKPGTYLLRVDGTKLATRFAIPEDSHGVFELGQVRLSSGKGTRVELVAKEVHITREEAPPAQASTGPTLPAVAAAPASTPAAAPRPGTLRGRLFRDHDGNGKWEETEPTFAGVRVTAGGVTAETGRNGEYVLEGVPAGAVALSVDAAQLPFGWAPPEVRVELPASGGERVADVHLLAPRLPEESMLPFEVALSEGSVHVVELERAKLSLASWAAGLPLEAREVRALARLAGRVLEGEHLRLLVVGHAQTLGPLRKATQRAWDGTRALKRYLQATQFVPASKVALTVAEPRPEEKDPLGHIELVLVRVAPGRR